MSRVAKMPIALPAGVAVNIAGQTVTIKGAKGELTHRVHDVVAVAVQDGSIKIGRAHV